ncbi:MULTISPECIES: ATP-binding cassette domain-containing protein [Pontibacillus]|uniref:ATP-binding cassette domain-containing protein n=1 Tax=Pontibacillus chungwhensis TaxID=265426 RepID=A0ABY8UYP1_9BACI|nr:MULTISPECIES: ATP-binding cassette domain-containing protein [Pontibacillus]MCD5325775.1 ATP-binding cassette domain-containing protein [Pontibacillus sp. HN14]WIF98308.1 ATP-binding cassette domain-containing protein [Pontibacillus chungwhensis]
MEHLKVNGVYKNFGEFTALEDVSFSVNKGEFVCLLGPSGCGKTTLLRIIAGLDQPNKGSVMMNEKDITHLPPAKRNFGIVFQSYALFPNLTAFQNIAYGLKTRKMRKRSIRDKVYETLRQVNLEHIADRYPAQLSGGQQQRVALARALALSPDFLLLDEPLSALDAKVRVELRNEMKRLQKQLGITTIMVTHDQEEALSMADKMVVMNNAELVQAGSPQEVYEYPLTPFVSDFIGTVNFLEDAYSLRAIRPEHVELKKDLWENSIPVSIENMEFRGGFYRMMLKNKVNKQARYLFADVSAEEYKKEQYELGQTIYMKFQESGMMHFKDYPVRSKPLVSSIS